MQEYVDRGKHSYLPLTRLDHRQHDAEFEAAFDVEYVHMHKSTPVSITVVHFTLHWSSLIFVCNGKVGEPM